MVGLPTPSVIDGGPNPPCCKQHGKNKHTEHEHPWDRYVFAAALAGHRDPSHANVSRVDDCTPCGPKTQTSYTSSSVSAQDTHEPDRHRLFFHVDTKHNLVCEPWADTKPDDECEHEWRAVSQMMTADVNVTRENVVHHCGRIVHPTRHRWGANPQCCKQHGGNKHTEHEELPQRRVMLQLTGRKDPSPAHALPTTSDRLREEIVHITCTKARDTNKQMLPMCARTQTVTRNIQRKVIAQCFAQHRVACQNIADRRLSEWRQDNCNVSEFLPLQSGHPIPPWSRSPWRKQHGMKTRTEQEERLHDVEHM